MSKPIKGRVKLKAPTSKGHREGAKVDPLSSQIPTSQFEDIIHTLSSNAVSSETKQRVIQRAVSQSPSVPIDLLSHKVPSLLDSGSMVTLIHERYFIKNILPLLQSPIGNLTEAHYLFWLSTANNEVMPVLKYFKADVTLLGFRVLWVGFLVVKDPNVLLECQCNTQLLSVIVCNLICLGCEEFGRAYEFNAFEEFHCLTNIHPIAFAQLCSFYHQSKLQDKKLKLVTR